MIAINSNEIKEKGLQFIDTFLENNEIVFVDKKYVILDVNEYNNLREQNLNNRYKEVVSKYFNKQITPKSADEHINEIEEMLKNV
jgi:hypothetical protein